MKTIRKATLAAAVAAAIGIGASGQAAASIYGGSALDIQNLNVALVNPTQGTTITSFVFTEKNTATLNGVNAPTQSASCGGLPGIPGGGTNNCNAALPRLDALAANAPGGTVVRANNDFSFFGPGSDTYSNSDSVITQAELTLDGPTATRQIAESEIQGTGDGQSNAEITSNTGFTMVFTVSGTGGLNVSFQADPYLRAVISALNFLNGNAQANINTSFSLTDGSGSQVTWTPNGTAANDCSVDAALVGVTCVETADGEDLNRNLSTSSNNTDFKYSVAAGFSNFGISIAGLTDGTWTLAFNSLTSNSVRAAVPEPGMLSLLGIGLMGLGYTRRRKVS